MLNFDHNQFNNPMKYLMLPLFFILAFSTQSQAQSNGSGKSYNSNGKVKFEDLRRPVVLKISPFHFFDNTLHLGCEIFKTSTYKVSLMVAGNLTYREGRTISDKGGSFEFQARYYPRGFKPDSTSWIRNSASGFYIGLGATLGTNEYKENIYDMVDNSFVQANSQWVTPAVVFGYQLIIWDALYLDLYLGGGMKVNDVVYKSFSTNTKAEDYLSSNSSIFSRYYKGILPKAGFTLGVGF